MEAAPPSGGGGGGAPRHDQRKVLLFAVVSEEVKDLLGDEELAGARPRQVDAQVSQSVATDPAFGDGWSRMRINEVIVVVGLVRCGAHCGSSR